MLINIACSNVFAILFFHASSGSPGTLLGTQRALLLLIAKNKLLLKTSFEAVVTRSLWKEFIT